MLLGEIAISVFLLFAGGTFLSFSTRFGQTGGAQITEASWGLVLGFYLVGLVQSGFSGAGLPFVSADVDYVFTAPVKTTEVFTAKILLNSVTTLLTFPPIFFLYLRATFFYDTPAITAVIAGLVTLVFFFMGLLFSADITLAQRSNTGGRMSSLKYVLTGLILVASMIPLITLIPGAQSSLVLSVIHFFPSGIVAEITVGLVSGLGISFGSYVFDFALLLVWLVGFSIIGVGMSRRQFYELLQVTNPDQAETSLNGKSVVSKLNPEGKSVWSVVRTKERILMSRTKEARGLIFELSNTLGLPGDLFSGGDFHIISDIVPANPVHNRLVRLGQCDELDREGEAVDFEDFVDKPARLRKECISRESYSSIALSDSGDRGRRWLVGTGKSRETGNTPEHRTCPDRRRADSRDNDGRQHVFRREIRTELN